MCKAGSLLLAIGFAIGPGDALAAADSYSSSDKLRDFMAQVRPQPTASQAGGQAVREAVAVPPARLQERADLLKAGEALLAQMQVDGALQAFERAALILHAADTEIALVRTYMQAGDYRRALAFGAHTAGAHLDVVGGSALYAWLLHIGGQPAIAQRLLSDTQTRIPNHPVVQGVREQLRSDVPRATGMLLALPTRLAPYGGSQGLPAKARVLGSGVLVPGGQWALVPLGLVPRSAKLWLRNGLGQLVEARLGKRLPAKGLALLRLQTVLPFDDGLVFAMQDAFPGSVGFAVEYVPAQDAEPAWPVLRTGFLGGVLPDGQGRKLGIGMPPGPRGGPVFDAAGRLAGMAISGKPGLPDQVLLVSQLRQALDQTPGRRANEAWGAQPAQGVPASAAVDKIYETSLRTSLQVIAAP